MAGNSDIGHRQYGASKRDELIRLLDTWGGEPARWPDHARDQIRALMDQVGDAQTLYSDARNLSRILDRAAATPALRPGDNELHARLADRISAAVLSTPSIAAAPATAHRPDKALVQDQTNVVSLQAEVSKGRAARATAREDKARPIFPKWQQAGALIAASLLAGIIIGGQIDMAPVVRSIAGVSASTADFEAAAISLGEDVIDEETL